MLATYVDELVTDDAFLRITGIGDLASCYLKVEGLNPAGSIKLKTARGLVRAAERTYGDLRGRRIVESTSGNLGVALASICAARGYSLTCVTDPNANASTVATMRALGAHVVVVDERDANGGFLGSRIAWIQELLRTDGSAVWLNQYENPANALAHESSTALALLQAFDRVDTLVVGVGTGGTLAGCLAAVRRFSPSTRIVAVDAIGSVTFRTPAGRRHLPGLGASRPSPVVDGLDPDVVVHVAEHDAVRECRWLATHAGLLAGASTGTVLAALRHLADELPRDGTVVALSPDLGDRYLASVYDDAWVARAGLDRPGTTGTHVSFRKEDVVDVLV
ncbi:2,3-diaminopropionate biosynthesis protein SbnA [Cellulomonas sp. HZM]|uniref:2,3-diaminopropionate biosynthesis protein SbnA n=1 Tax=Cellulomonas sp. HZM TaxID=1454010 RepID=UPI000690FB04|nr:2,3-diaminopropionate biosynthesis protein SbnA [Cellulomonas sp. HZM]